MTGKRCLAVFCTLYFLLSSNLSTAIAGCDVSFSLSLSTIGNVFISPNPDFKQYQVYIADSQGPVYLAAVTVTFPACFTVVAEDALGGAWCSNFDNNTPYSYTLYTNLGGYATFNFHNFTNKPKPSGGCLPFPSTCLHCGFFDDYVEVFVSYYRSGITYCNYKDVAIVSPDVVDGAGRLMCDGWEPWVYSSVGLADAVDFAGFLISSTYSRCHDLNSDNRVGLSDQVILTPYIANATSCELGNQTKPNRMRR
jgi:hypothetical protein